MDMDVVIVGGGLGGLAVGGGVTRARHPMPCLRESDQGPAPLRDRPQPRCKW